MRCSSFRQARVIAGMQVFFWIISMPGFFLLIEAPKHANAPSGPGSATHVVALSAAYLLPPMLLAGVVNLLFLIWGLILAIRPKLEWSDVGKENLFLVLALSPAFYWLAVLFIVFMLFTQPM